MVTRLNKATRWSISLAMVMYLAVPAEAQNKTKNALRIQKDSVKEEKAKLARYHSEAVWVGMMDDSTTNYHEAMKAFEEFWRDRRRPSEKEESLEIKLSEEHSWLEKIFKAKEIKEEKLVEQYSFAHKRFLNWMQVNAPFVQPDGRILSPEERLELWKKQKEQDQF
jgi:hypothetical protein